MQYITQCLRYTGHHYPYRKDNYLLFQIVKEQPIVLSSRRRHPYKFVSAFVRPAPWAVRPFAGGANRDRTDDLLLAKQALSQLSYGPADLSCAVRLEPCASNWWVWMDSNHRPPPYQDGALTN
jgi:hypothetical protein